MVYNSDFYAFVHFFLVDSIGCNSYLHTRTNTNHVVNIKTICIFTSAFVHLEIFHFLRIFNDSSIYNMS